MLQNKEKRAKILQVSQNQNKLKAFSKRTYFLRAGCPSLILYIIHSPLLSWFRKISFGLLPLRYPTLAQWNNVSYWKIRMWETEWKRERGTVGSLLVRTTSSTASESSRSSQLSSCLQEWNSASAVHPHKKGRVSPPRWKLSDTSAKSIRGVVDASEPWLCVIFLDILPLQWIFPPFFLRQFACYVALSSPEQGLRMDAEKAAEWGEPLVLPLRLSLSLAFSLPRTCPLPASHCTSPPFHFLSPPLLPSHTHRDMHFSSSGFWQLLLCHFQPCQTERFTAPTPQRNK